MNITIRLILLFLTIILLTGCESNDDEDCVKTIIIIQSYWANNRSYSYDITQEVPCDYPESSEPELIEPPALENFTYEILSFEFIPDTGNNTSRLKFEIKLNNPNNYSVSGVPILTTNTDGLEATMSFSNNTLISCSEIGVNSNCILTYDQQSSLDLGITNSIKLINVQYFLINQED